VTISDGDPLFGAGERAAGDLVARARVGSSTCDDVCDPPWHVLGCEARAWLRHVIGCETQHEDAQLAQLEAVGSLVQRYREQRRDLRAARAELRRVDAEIEVLSGKYQIAMDDRAEHANRAGMLNDQVTALARQLEDANRAIAAADIVPRGVADHHRRQHDAAESTLRDVAADRDRLRGELADLRERHWRAMADADSGYRASVIDHVHAAATAPGRLGGAIEMARITLAAIRELIGGRR